VHSFIDALRNRRTKLRFLDITGLPIAEIIIKYVATHCRLAQKEYQRNCLIDEYLQNVSDLETLCEKSNSGTATTNTTSITTSQNNSGTPPPLIRNDLKKTTSLPDEQLVFKFDCILQERATYDELMGALEANSLNTRFSLQVAKLDLLCLGKTNIIKLLDKLEKTHIEGLRLQYNSITEESIKDIIPLLSQLRNLRALDLSCNLIDYRQNPESSRQMADMLGELPHLNRLDLSGSPLGGCLFILLSAIKKPLQYLSLHSCGLLDVDLNYLATSMHTQVEHLDLSENRLTRFSDSLISLLKKCSPNLCVLELDDNRFDSIDYLTIICVTRKMSKLKMLATKGTFVIDDHLLGCEFLHHSSSLIAWRISYPIDIYDPSETDLTAIDASKRHFVERMNNIIKEKFKLIVNELFL
jgi:Ran GTPase-activating protein (RanGAP) involved in mRNA processing and transport